VSLDLAGRAALVTGATRGLGLAVAAKLHASGAAVALSYSRSEDDAARAVKGLSDDGSRVLPVKADVSRPDSWPRLLDEASAAFGRLDILVHSAASWRPMSAVAADLPALHEDLSAALDPLLLAAPAIRQAMPGGGRIVAVSSSGARSVVPGYVSLGLAKAALESLVRYLAVDLAPAGITVNAVSTAKLDKGPATPRPEMARALAARTPAGRLTTPADLADAIALLCTDEAAWVQGQVITVDGGLSLRG
jgi:enoyl-[acyl-carrier protein] reductase III